MKKNAPFFNGGTWADLRDALYGKKGTPKRDALDKKEVSEIIMDYKKRLLQ